ncbi:MAG: NAD(P)/FAD-dependent oxidoreductase [Solirubrobacterales bacterium]
MARILILGAGFGGLELSTFLSERLGDEAEVTVIDKGEGFVFGYSKLDVMFHGKSVEEVRLPYADFVKPGVRLLRETVTAIDPAAKRVTTDAGVHEADYLVIALGADYDLDATPGMRELDSEFYTVAGAEKLAATIPTFSSGRALIGVCGAPFKCPPAPSECALLLDDDLRRRGVRDDCEITFVIPLGAPVPPSPETSAALKAAFAERGIELITGRRIASVDPARKVAVLDDGAELPFELFLGVPKHRAPDVVLESGIAEDGYVPVDPATLATKAPGVYAVGDVATAGVPKAGIFAEGAAKIVAQHLLAEIAGGDEPGRHLGQGTCYIEFGEGRIGSVDIDFLSGPERTGHFNPPSAEQMALKEKFGADRRARWFGL